MGVQLGWLDWICLWLARESAGLPKIPSITSGSRIKLELAPVGVNAKPFVLLDGAHKREDRANGRTEVPQPMKRDRGSSSGTSGIRRRSRRFIKMRAATRIVGTLELARIKHEWTRDEKGASERTTERQAALSPKKVF